MLHVRLGDTVCGWNKSHKFVPKGIQTILTFLKKNIPIDKKITIVWGNHRNLCVQESKNYLDSLVKAINKAGYTIETQTNSNKDADIDFCTMVNSDIFIQGTGGYSHLVRRVRAKLGRNTISDKNLVY